MEEQLKAVKEHWNALSDSDWYQSLRTGDQLSRLEKDPSSAFHPGVWERIKRHMGEVRGKRVLLPSSGDNHAAFAFSLMGAKVTSADISERQLENAKDLAEKLGLTIQFVCDNTMELGNIADNAYDLVYTSNGTLSWINDLSGMYRNISRVLADQGLSVMYDLHPFNRPFSGEAWKEPKIIKSYQDVLPDLHWQVGDIVNSHIEAGLSIQELAELWAADASFWFHYTELVKKTPEELKDINDWRKNPMAALPAWLVVISKKAPRGMTLS